MGKNYPVGCACPTGGCCLRLASKRFSVALMGPHILLVEDDENLRLVLADNLEEEGYGVATAASLAEARLRLAEKSPDFVILDVMLPDGDGYSFCRELRTQGLAGPILMLTARTLESDIVDGLKAGADDYVAKPYRLGELLARIEALLRRSGGSVAITGRPHRLGDIHVDPMGRSVRDAEGCAIGLTRTEFDLLMCLLLRPNQVLSRQQILAEAWSDDVVVEPRTVDNFISSLKKKLRWQPDSTWRITTVRGVGYRFELSATASSTSSR